MIGHDDRQDLNTQKAGQHGLHRKGCLFKGRQCDG